MPATLPQLLRCHCLHAPPLLGSLIANPTTRCSPARKPPQPHATSSVRALPAFAATRSQCSCRRCTQRTAELQHRQLRHPSETRCQRRCPSCSDVIAYTHRHSSARPLQTAQPAAAQRANRPSPKHTTSSGHCRRSHSAAAADARSVPLSFSIVSRVILPRLGASDAAPAA